MMVVLGLHMSKNELLQVGWRPIVLIILDGWGVAPEGPGNVIGLAKTPFFNELLEKYPSVTLRASGQAVGLSSGVSGNCQAGHLTLGAGRPVFGGAALINRAITDKSFFKLPVWTELTKHLKKYQSVWHLVGLLSVKNEISDLNHLLAILEVAKRKKLTNRLRLHLFVDSTSPADQRLLTSLKIVEDILSAANLGCVASLSGGFYGLNVDRHWERTAAVYKVLTAGVGEKSGSVFKALAKAAGQKLSGDNLLPTTLVDSRNRPVGLVQDNDALFFFNFLPDGSRQLLRSLIEPAFDRFARKKINNLVLSTMTDYGDARAVFARSLVKNTLSEVLSSAGRSQLKIAESEKYNQLTTFFNGHREIIWPAEEWLLVPSPRNSSRNQAPAMAAEAVTQAAIKQLDEHYDFVAINLTNAEVAARDGDLTATRAAVKAIDGCLRRLLKKIIASDGLAIITADHGRVEDMINRQLGVANLNNSDNPVPFIIAGNGLVGYNLGMDKNAVGDLTLMSPAGTLADVAPTILKLMNLNQPEEMTGKSLL